jgi:hypothetical protein
VTTTDISAALCPSAPLLVRDLGGSDPALADLRAACAAAVGLLLRGGPAAITVLGAAPSTSTWSARTPWNWAAYRGGPAPAEAGNLPLSLGLGVWLLQQAGFGGRVQLHGIGYDEQPDRCAEIGRRLRTDAGDDRLHLLVIGDGSARRKAKGPGHFDEHAQPFDAEVERALRGGDLTGLLELDSRLARELMVAGLPAWRALAGAAGDRTMSCRMHYCDDPYGVAYFVASLATRGSA